MRKTFQFLLLTLLPKNLCSRLAGMLADAKLPSPLLFSVIHLYAKFYKIRLNEMKHPVSKMKTFNEFFTRELHEGARTIDPAPNSVVSPVDGTIAEFGTIKQGLLVQTKGILYSIYDLIGDRDGKVYEDGYFITVYLSPADYHRIHAPVGGKIAHFSYYSGNLWPVNQFGVENIGGLFAINERIYTPIESTAGTVGLVKVGATVVGKIKLNFSNVESNRGSSSQLHIPVFPPKGMEKGEELGRFQLGSTVILLFKKGQITPMQLYQGRKLRLGERIAILNPPPQS